MPSEPALYRKGASRRGELERRLLQLWGTGSIEPGEHATRNRGEDYRTAKLLPSKETSSAVFPTGVQTPLPQPLQLTPPSRYNVGTVYRTTPMR